MVMAAAVVNWIPAKPYDGKMPTAGYKAGDIIQVPFVLAPRVIDEMRQINPNLTLVGCKLLSRAKHKDLIAAAYEVIQHSKCHTVIANDLKNLQNKYLVMPDRSVHKFENDFDGMYKALTEIIEDRHYRTEFLLSIWGSLPATKKTRDRRTLIDDARGRFDNIVKQYRDRFVPDGDGRVFGSLAVRVTGNLWLVSPREKGEMFSSKDAVLVMNHDDWNKPDKVVSVFFGENFLKQKATLDAPLLIRAGDRTASDMVLHLHEQLPDVPTVPYAPPGTERDNNREIPAPAFNIKGHGFIQVLD